MPTSIVEYRDIDGFPGYQIGSDGNARSHVMGDVWSPLAPVPTSGGYRQITLVSLGGKHVVRPLHQLVLTAFAGPAPKGMEPRHGNGVRFDNRRENLTWGTHVENEADKHLHGTAPVGEKNPSARLGEDDVREIRRMMGMGVSKKQIAAQFGVTATSIYHISTGRNWGWLK